MSGLLSESRSKRERWLICRYTVLGVGWANFLWSPSWLRAGFVIVVAACWVRASWQYRQERRLDKDPQTPEGMVSVTLASGRKVYVPPTPELLAAVDHIVELVGRTAP